MPGATTLKAVGLIGPGASLAGFEGGGANADASVDGSFDPGVTFDYDIKAVGTNAVIDVTDFLIAGAFEVDLHE